MKQRIVRVLITAGPVYGPLDDNKVVSNRARGYWAMWFANFLKNRKGPEIFDVQLLVPDIMSIEHSDVAALSPGDIIRHEGFEDYQAQCLEMAPHMDVMVMAAAVLNWIPAEPVKGKMISKGYKPGDIINIPFKLTPHVIDQVKKPGDRKTLIGCKLLSGAPHEALVEAASGVILNSRSNVVVANDLQDLKTKHLVYPDGTVVTHQGNFGGFYEDLLQVILDEHYQTVVDGKFQFPYSLLEDLHAAQDRFDRILEANRSRFVQQRGGTNRVFGSIAVPILPGIWLCSPREKGESFDALDAVPVAVDYEKRVSYTRGGKATLNAPLLIRVGEKFGNKPVLHLHEQLPGVPTVPYAPPGTVRDSDRDIPGPVFNIQGHGFIQCLDE